MGIWLPDADEHFERMMERVDMLIYGGKAVGTYQFHKLADALDMTRGRRVAVDAGAHVGFWSMWLAKDFARVHAFEPVPEHAECFRMNVTQGDVTLHEVALGARAGKVAMQRVHENSGKAHAIAGSEVEVITLDSLGLRDVDLIKIDVEGFEHRVLAGARDTIERCKPVIVVEDNQHQDDENESKAVRLLRSMGMRCVKQIGRDFFFKW